MYHLPSLRLTVPGPCASGNARRAHGPPGV